MVIQMRRVLEYLKKDVVLFIALLLAILSSFFVKPSEKYLDYIDFRVISLLFCLMLVVAGWKKTGVFEILGNIVTTKVKTTRGLTFVMVGLCFFFSMFITNDVALITFVPFTISMFYAAGIQEKLVNVIVLETIAANMGSVLTPIGNPQNLYLFSLSGISADQFVLDMLPVWLVSFLCLAIMMVLQKNIPLQKDLENKEQEGRKKDKKFWLRFVGYFILFFVCLLNIFRILTYQAVLVIVFVVIFIIDRTLFKRVDYSLLITFVGFFIFVGNMEHIEWVSNAIEKMMEGREMTVAVLTSQIISNVPAAMLLSGFTTNYRELLYGVNIGGLGTLIASMASLISYKFYAATEGADKGAYIRKFTVQNLVMLAGLLALAWIML